LGGLEAAVAPFSELERTMRIDAEYFKKDFLATQEALEPLAKQHVVALTHVSDGNHFTISEDFVDEGVPYYRGQDVVGHFFVESAAPNFITEEAYNRKYMKRSHLKRGDVLLSIVGTIGELSLVDSTAPATCSCKLAILRPHSLAPEVLAIFLQSKHGRNQVKRLTRGAIQGSLLLEDMDQLWVPDWATKLPEKIAATVQESRNYSVLVRKNAEKAEAVLLKALGLASWAPPEPLAYSASSGDAFVSGRLDAQFFAPRIQQLIDHLSDAGTTIGTVATPRREKFDAAKHGDFDYIEIGDLDGTGTTGSSRVAADEAPSRATWFVRPGDIITSTVRPIRRLSAQIASDQDGYVCSSGFVVLDPTGVQPELLLTYLRLPVICELMDLFASASMYPAISEPDILALPFPAVDAETEQAVVSAVPEGRAARARARALLDAAKRAVEIAIEDSEAAALAYLDKMGAA
jgi:type I restriction enzyme, S subunit